jgi:hypothetical protein
VATLFEQLVQINSDITEAKAAGFRSCLLRIFKQIDTEPESLALSLQEWGRWLDDGGYEREDFAAILLQITEAELGVPAASTLWTYAESIGAAAEGIPSLIEHVQTDYPGLEQRMTSLEALALDDEGLIEHTAGGMGTTGRIVTSTVGTVAGIAVVYGLTRLYQSRRAKHIEQEAGRMEREAQENAEKHIERMAEMFGDRQVREDGLAIQYDKKTMQAMYRDRSKVFDFKGCADKTLADLEEREVYKLKMEVADNIATRHPSLQSDVEKKLSKGTGRIDDIDRWKKIMDKPEFEDYFKDQFHLRKADEVLSMSEDKFLAFVQAEGKSFYKGGLEVKRTALQDLENQTEDYFDTAIGDIEKDIEIDVFEELKVAGKQVETQIVTETEKTVGRVEGEVENWEKAFDADLET